MKENRLSKLNIYLIIKNRILYYFVVTFAIVIPLLFVLIGHISKEEMPVQQFTLVIFWMSDFIICIMRLKYNKNGLNKKLITYGYSLFDSEKMRLLSQMIICLSTGIVNLTIMCLAFPKIYSFSISIVFVFAILKYVMLLNSVYIIVDNDIAAALMSYMFFAIETVPILLFEDFLPNQASVIMSGFICRVTNGSIEASDYIWGIVGSVLEIFILGVVAWRTLIRRIKDEKII